MKGLSSTIYLYENRIQFHKQMVIMMDYLHLSNLQVKRLSFLFPTPYTVDTFASEKLKLKIVFVTIHFNSEEDVMS